MPLYDYECRNCGHRVEVLHGVNDSGPATCEVCGGQMRKLINPPAIVFKGSGWAKKDARDAKPAAPAAKATAKASTDGDGTKSSDSGSSSDSSGGSTSGDSAGDKSASKGTSTAAASD